MADNVNLTAGDGTIVAGTDTIGGVAYPRAKVVWGPDGTVNDTDVASGKPLPTQLRASTGQTLSDSTGILISTSQISSLGAATSAASTPVVLASDQKFFANAYETVAASQTAQVLGGSGATGDYISHILVIPSTTSPGNVLLLDNATSITVFTGGASSVTTLHPFTIDLRTVSVSGAWKITTGANVSCIGVGKFT